MDARLQTRCGVHRSYACTCAYTLAWTCRAHSCTVNMRMLEHASGTRTCMCHSGAQAAACNMYHACSQRSATCAMQAHRQLDAVCAMQAHRQLHATCASHGMPLLGNMLHAPA
eukprot:351599-Chlamydomonas_euryale.AAC.10